MIATLEWTDEDRSRVETFRSAQSEIPNLKPDYTTQMLDLLAQVERFRYLNGIHRWNQLTFTA